LVICPPDKPVFIYRTPEFRAAKLRCQPYRNESGQDPSISAVADTGADAISANSWTRPAGRVRHDQGSRHRSHGRIDLLIASDFSTSVLLRNVPDSTAAGWHFRNETSSSPITDENGMGSSLLDIDNDGNLEWFVTSILDPEAVAAGNWGKTGNRLYSNASTTDQIAFTDITTQAGVGDGYWGWGSCAADFNNDGFIDLFHVNGFGNIPASAGHGRPGSGRAAGLPRGHRTVPGKAIASFHQQCRRNFLQPGNWLGY
jgi:hypothetical protein